MRKSILLVVCLAVVMASCAGNAVINSLQKSGCLVKTYHERAQTGEIKIECYRTEELD